MFWKWFWPVAALLMSVVAYGQSPQIQTDLINTILLGVPSNNPTVLTAASLRNVLNTMAVSSTGGVSQNITNVQNSTNYAIQSSDCGKTIQMGGGLFTATLPSAIGSFIPNCTVTLQNGDTGRGKILAGFPSDINTTILWPLQTVQVQIINGAWKTKINPGRWKLTGPVTFNLDNSLGIDTSDGLGTGNQAFLSISQFTKVLSQQIDTQGQTVTAQLASSQTWTNVLINATVIGGGTLVLNGGGDTITSTSTNAIDVSIAPTAGTVGNVASAILALTNMTITCSGGANGLFQRVGFTQISSLVTFGTCTGGAHMWVDSPLSKVLLVSNYTVSGGAAEHLLAAAGGFIEYNSNAFTVTVSGTPAFSGAFALAFSGGVIFSVANFSGSATGTRYNANTGGTIDTNGGGANYFPGNAAGLMVQGGHYDSPGTPGASSCGGTGLGSPSGSDMSGFVVEGQSTTGCTLTFTTTNVPTACTVSSSSATVQAGLVVSTLNSTTLSVTHPSNGATNPVLYWVCPQRVN